MKLTHIATESGKTGCPSFFSTDRGTYVVQGWRITDAEARAALQERGLPDHEDAIEIPAALVQRIRESA
ncbi:hypothetical protein GCM10010174_70360 [Kutzneria viridogrisea]|uniref:Uncharacterized protein n=2 Tax=Kutzneria TaxID=43356 RepID=W5WB98_9PSEU|nr:hypothetical protein [Kutzneria albida]AHH98443.1 hypothetical protein KALB_5081 [Kutzneria albida DSM 43870]MBA8923972.1 hypothetical protein [Kutzneria viridogrisea]